MNIRARDLPERRRLDDKVLLAPLRVSALLHRSHPQRIRPAQIRQYGPS